MFGMDYMKRGSTLVYKLDCILYFQPFGMQRNPFLCALHCMSHGDWWYHQSAGVNVGEEAV
jgi:hypothetical protein